MPMAAADARLRRREVIPLTQEFLGQMLGVRRTTVTVAARLLQSAGMIRYRRGLVQVVDRPALEEIACECYAVVKSGTPTGCFRRRLVATRNDWFLRPGPDARSG